MSDSYTVEYHEFLAPASIGGVTVDNIRYSGTPMRDTPDGVPSGILVAISNLGCSAADYEGVDVEGKVALILRGVCPFSDKNLLASAAGALGAVVYNAPDSSLVGTPVLGGPNPAFIPMILLLREKGLALLGSISAGPKIATMDVVTQPQITYNVIAQTKGGDQNNVLVIGAHSDSVAAGPGMNDDGSGTIALLEVAQQLSKFSVNNAVRFGWWAAEEVGLVGSTAYVQSLSAEELSKITLYLNFDMLASPNFICAIYDGDGSAFNISGPPGSAAAEKLFEDFFDNDLDLNHVPTAFDSRSDYAAFAAAGIPVGGLFTGAEVLKTPAEVALFGGKAGVAYDVNYHGIGDTIKNLNVGAWLQNTKAIAHAVATYAVSFASLGIGKRDERVAKREEWRREIPTRGLDSSKFDAHHVGARSGPADELLVST